MQNSSAIEGRRAYQPNIASTLYANVTAKAKNMGLYTVTILYDLRGYLVSPKRLQPLDDLVSNLSLGAQYIAEKMHTESKIEQVIVVYSVTTKALLSTVNGVLGTFKIFHSYYDLKHNFIGKSIWKQHNIVFKAFENSCGFVGWILSNGLPKVAASTGKTAITTFSARTTVSFLKSFSGVIACVFALIDVGVAMQQMKKGDSQKKSWVAIMGDGSKMFAIILGGGLGFFTPGSPIWIACLISWAVAGVLKARIEIHEERAQHAMCFRQ